MTTPQRQREIETMHGQNLRLRSALHEIETWSRAYPLKVFPEPDFAKAAELLKAGGITLDAISASNMRHVVEGVGNTAREALKNTSYVAAHWQPIETAPKDRTILISGRYPNGRAYVEESYWDYRGHFRARQFEPPTHWQPMPEPHGGWDIPIEEPRTAALLPKNGSEK